MSSIAITFDIDWAPDWAIDLSARICQKAGVPATFFATHATDVLTDLRRDPAIELGVHPNFLQGSSHGATVSEVMGSVLRLVPEAVSMRTHSLVQSTPILNHVIRESPIRCDVSIFLPFHTPLFPTFLYTGKTCRGLVRLPYYWEDDLAADWPGWSWDKEPELPDQGIRIFDFHPIHIALNMASMVDYVRLKQSLGTRPLSKATPKDCAPFVHSGAGARTFLERLVAAWPRHYYAQVSDLAERAR